MMEESRKRSVNMYGLTEQDMTDITNSIKEFPVIEQVVLFGSRAKGNYKRGSDVDLAVKGKNITNDTIFRIRDELNEEKPLPYFFDVLNYNYLDKNISDIIDETGVVIYRAET